jgi:aspartyl-tRNA synthetase
LWPFLLRGIMQRTHLCLNIDDTLIGQNVTIEGWVHAYRNLGGVIFIYIRDRSGSVQVKFDPADHDIYRRAEKLRSEFVVKISGAVQERPKENINANYPNGNIEILVSDLTIHNPSNTPPFELTEEDISEELRLKYRYLDLRRDALKNNLIFRSQAVHVIRNYMNELGFLDIETPVLMRSTPEGARDFLVPSRNFKGRFYALPQSPQTYKQVLMVAGFDRYYQVAKCFRDEDLRKDRQPEFTQIDIEMSFVDEDDVMTMAEGLIQAVYKQTKHIDVSGPFERVTYAECMEKYGSDKPDRRFGLQLQNVSQLFTDSGFNAFKSVVNSGGSIYAIYAPDAYTMSRKDIDKLIDMAKKWGAKGLSYLKHNNGELQGQVLKFLAEEEQKALMSRLQPTGTGIIFLVADATEKAQIIAGQLRLHLAEKFELIDHRKIDLFWVVDFPMFEYDDEEQRYVARHHPFTSPKDNLETLAKNPDAALARAYDLVLNGNEIAGGSIRIHQSELQKKVFDLLKISADEADDKFGFLLNALQYGAPPHGGIAFGLDRMLMLMQNAESIRDVIAFPKTASGNSLMDKAPSEVSSSQLSELGLSIIRSD